MPNQPTTDAKPCGSSAVLHWAKPNQAKAQKLHVCEFQSAQCDTCPFRAESTKSFVNYVEQILVWTTNNNYGYG